MSPWAAADIVQSPLRIAAVRLAKADHHLAIPGTKACLVITLLLALGCATCAAAELQSPISPTDSLAHLVVETGLRVELVACEPQVIDPIAIRFDEDGRLWVVEMRDYPDGPPTGKAPRSRISVLEDRDRDGRYEFARVFAEGLLFPTGLQLWRGGAIVTGSGQVLYLKDSDGDGRCDLSEVWFTGFAEENPQLRANHPRLALDNRVTIANGLRGGQVVNARDPQAKPISISGMDFAFDPLTGRGTSATGNGQFGLTFDNFGNRFFCNNRAPVEHVVLESRYLERNPFFAAGTAVSSVAAGGEQSHVFPLVRAWTTSNLHEGQFTAACGLEIYRDDALGETFEGNAFVCEPTGSLVHRELVRTDGVTFTSKPAQAGKEFLASGDPWFRPVNLEVGPDGALYVVDMYRAVIEHPQFMPSELQKRPDLRLGDDAGRIYRVVRNAAVRVPTPQLSTATSASLVALLGHKNAWWRETAARLLLERQDAGVTNRLQAIARDGNALARLHALSVLSGLGRLDSATLIARCDDAHPRVRELAIRLAESRLDQDAQLCAAVARTAADADARVRFQAALTLGGTRKADVQAVLAKIAVESAGDPWMRKAVCTSHPELTAGVLQNALLLSQSKASAQPEHLAALLRGLAEVVGARGEREEIKRTLANLSSAAAPSDLADAVLLGLCEGSHRHGRPLTKVLQTGSPDGSKTGAPLDQAFERAVQTAVDTAASEPTRMRAIGLAAHAGSEQASSALLRLATSDASSSIRTQAVTALAGYSDEKTAHKLLASWDEQTPAARHGILDLLMARAATARILLTSIADKKLARAELGLARENALRNYADAETRALARTLLAAAADSDRARVLAAYQPALDLTPDALSGKALFARHCANCHRIEGVGHEVGPDISDLRTKTPPQLLVDILNPNQAIDNNYVSYTVTTTTGIVHRGLIAAETPSSIRLRQAEGKSFDLLRSEIESLRSSGVSLMPDGVEKELSPQQLADVIAYVKNWRYLADPAAEKLAPAAK